MRGLRVFLGLAAITALATTASSRPEREFPHLAHQGLFPLCTGCHVGIPTGDTASFFPNRSQCEGCHEDNLQPVIDFYSRPDEPRPTNLHFSHPTHDQDQPDGQVLDCTTCHVEPGQPRMAVRPPQPEQCLSCHAHQATSHYVDARCTSCHVPLATTAFSANRVRTLPVPEDHTDDTFLRRSHGSMARAQPQRCATCHTRERCTSCHVDASAVPAIATIPAAGARLELPDFPAHYFTPGSHLDEEAWLRGHGAAASADLGQCSTCHTRNDCTVCHTVTPPAPVEALPPRKPRQAPGVLLSRNPPPSHDLAEFMTEHGNRAVTENATCAACHTRRFCEDCHNAPANAGFHPADFALRHKSAAYSGRLECQNCHDVRSFCRDCHTQTGMGAVATLGPGFHDAQPSWLLRHGQAARQSLETCTSCHVQQDCMQCHSAQSGPFRVNPHGPGFDAQRMYDRNPIVCTACHIGNPLQGGTP